MEYAEFREVFLTRICLRVQLARPVAAAAGLLAGGPFTRLLLLGPFLLGVAGALRRLPGRVGAQPGPVPGGAAGLGRGLPVGQGRPAVAVVVGRSDAVGGLGGQSRGVGRSMASMARAGGYCLGRLRILETLAGDCQCR